MTTTTVLGSLYLLAWLFAIVIGILWFFMPFAIFGTKDILRQLVREQRRTNELLAQLQASRMAAEPGSD